MSESKYNARYDLVDWLKSHPDMIGHFGTPEETADAILRRHAHELAEKIRAHNFNPAGGAEPYDVADYIDPEVS